jgi:hypothetical protein
MIIVRMKHRVWIYYISCVLSVAVYLFNVLVHHRDISLYYTADITLAPLLFSYRHLLQDKTGITAVVWYGSIQYEYTL